MYFIADGAVDIVSGVSDKAEFRLHAGDCFGELALLFRERRTKSCRSRGLVTLYKLSQQGFEEATKAFPEVRDQLLSMAETRRLQAVRGGSIADAFRKSAPLVCDELMPLDLTGKLPWTFGIPLWELRSLIKDVLILWSEAQIDWLISGADNLSNDSPTQAIDYRTIS